MTASLAFSANAYAPGMRHPPHRHDELQVSLVVAGGVAETVGHVTEDAGALSVVAKDAGVVHADEFGAAGARIARLTLPNGTVRDLLDDPRRGSDWRWSHDPAAARPFLRLIARAGEQHEHFESTDTDVVDLVAALTARRVPTHAGEPPAWLSQTIEEMRQTWHPRMTVGEVASRAGVHPVYLARCVRRWYGTSVGSELRRMRLRSAARAVADGGGTVSNVAHTSGFADEAHLCRDFDRSVGITPGRYRTLVRGLEYRR